MNHLVGWIFLDVLNIGHLRTHQEHRSNALKTPEANTPTERSTLEINTGSHFTEFSHLQYFDYIWFTT